MNNTQAIHTFAQNMDLVALSTLTQTVIDMPYVLDVVFIHLEPRELLSPVREFLDQFDTSLENFGELLLGDVTDEDEADDELAGQVMVILWKGMARSCYSSRRCLVGSR